jgi:hypothetical protein
VGIEAKITNKNHVSPSQQEETSVKFTSKFLFIRSLSCFRGKWLRKTCYPFYVIFALGLFSLLLAACSPKTASPSDIATPQESTDSPTLTLPTLPTPTFKPTIQEDFKLQGYGDFPLFPVIATASDGKTLALYMVEGDKATQLRIFEGTSWMDDQISVQTSPDNQHLALLLQKGEDGTTTLEVTGISGAESYLIARGAGNLNPAEKGSAFEFITSSAWLDNKHLLYSKVTFPSSAEWDSNRQANLPIPIQAKTWISTLDGEEQRLLTDAPVYRVLGGSSDGKTLYVTRLIPGHEEWGMEGFSLLNVGSGSFVNLWPVEEQAPAYYYDIGMVVLPDGSSRVGLVYLEQGPGTTVATSPPTIWMGNPDSRELEVSWTVNHGTPYAKGDSKGATYAFPQTVLWSPSSKQEFIYSADGIWKVDLLSQTEQRLVDTGVADLQAWTPEGIIISNNSTGVLQLLDEFGVVQGEIKLGYILHR